MSRTRQRAVIAAAIVLPVAVAAAASAPAAAGATRVLTTAGRTAAAVLAGKDPGRVVAGPGTGTVSVAVPGGTWGKAQKIPNDPGIGAVSCATPGNCSAVGGSAALSETKGTWGKAGAVPGVAALNSDGDLTSVSCASPGNCGAAGQYVTPTAGPPPPHAFVASQENGRWGRALPIPRMGEINSLSCASAGSCSAGGGLFAVSETKGTWGRAREVPGLAALSTNGDVTSVSCASAGSCSAGGYYESPASNGEEAFVVNQENGRWGRALPIPRMGEIDSLSCASAGSCSAGGGLFTVSETKGTWGRAREVPGLAALSEGGYAHIISVSCASAGTCSAGGYTSVHFGDQGFVVSQDNGVWGKAERIPGLAALSTGTGGQSYVVSVSCGAAGNCSAAGNYERSERIQGYVVSQDNGVWGTAEEVPGLAALNKGGFALAGPVSCASAGNCSAVGVYSDRSRNSHAFVVSQVNRPPAAR